MKYILTDIDDTILKFADAFQDWAAKHGYHSKGKIRDGYSIENAFGCTVEEADELIVRFSEHDAMAYLEPEPDALEVLPILHDKGYKFVAISACVNSDITVQHRHKNLNDVFGIKWHDVHCVGLHQSKENHLRMYDTTWWVEDNVKHAHKGAEIGHHSLLLDREYNKHLQIANNPHRVNNWHEIFEKIMNSEKK